jgi:hypothetical protein
LRYATMSSTSVFMQVEEYIKLPYTEADNLEDAYEMAEDVLCLRLYDTEESNELFKFQVLPTSRQLPE